MQTYDDVYARTELYWGAEPNRLCLQVVDMLRPSAEAKKVVDLGCGEGKDTIHFARNGHVALGVDLSRPGIEKGRKWAADEGVPTSFQQGDLNLFRLSESFDVVYSSGTLTYIAPERRSEAFQNYKQHTRIGGIHAFNVFVEKPYIPTPPDWGMDEYFYRSGELLQYYWDWEVVDFREIVFDCDSSGVPHRHAMDVLVVKRVV